MSGGLGGFDPMSMAASLVVGSLFQSLTAKKPEQPAQATPMPAAPAPAAAQVPIPGTFAAANKAAGSTGVSSTELNGPGGIDSSVLKLGRNTLLGA